MKRTSPTRHAALVLLSLSACTLVDKQLGELDSSTGADESSGGGSTGDGMTSNASSPDTGGSETGEGEVCDPSAPMTCASDPDHDNLGFACDNADERFNPDQSDFDSDGIGDVIDLCPTVAGANNTADSDGDGIGNDCDSCRHTTTFYNVASFPLQGWQQVRNIPDIGDLDGDGIGDACDNCIAVPNCEAYDVDNPWAPGDPIAWDDPNLCQRDDDQDMIGDACAGMQLEGAAGLVGLAEDDDFDQDGITNMLDGCMRLPLPERIVCDGDEDCPQGVHCETTMDLCNHPDADGDTVGDACDTCPFAANGEQLVEGGLQEDDEDGDFVGEVCEVRTAIYPSPLPMAFWSLSANGLCCSVALVEDDMTGDLVDPTNGLPLLDPDGLPIRIDCTEAEDPELRTCRALPPQLASAPGVLTPPPGCDGMIGEPATNYDDPVAYWQTRCELPLVDQDFDGIGDQGDLCPFAFDPENLPYVDEGGMVWEHDGKYCNGEYSLDAQCGD